MNFIREIVRLKYEMNFSQREIAKSVGKSRDSVSNVLKMVSVNNLDYKTIVNMPDDKLIKLIYPNSNPYRDIPEPNLEYIDKELKTNKHMTMMILHEEYLKENPNGLKYTQFCERYRDYIKTRKISMHVERKSGERMEIDWVGDKYQYIDNFGNKCKACLFVTTLGRSGYPYVEAFPNQKAISFNQGIINALQYYGGVPKIFVPDNDKGAVIKASKYEPIFNPTFNEIVTYYGAVSIPARVRTPKDKPNVEKSVFDVVERYILLKMRNMNLHSIAEINKFIRSLLKEFVNKPFQKKEGSRQSVFDNEDKPALLPLPSKNYELFDIVMCKVNIDYHIEYDKKYYSVPYQLIGQKVEVHARALTIEIWHNNTRIYTHQRSYKNSYTTINEHMPKNHQTYNKYNQTYFKTWAKTVSNDVYLFVCGLFNGVIVEEIRYRACLGLMNLARSNKKILIDAVTLCNENQTYSFHTCNEIFKRLLKAPSSNDEIPIINNNIRGKNYYK